MSVFLNTILFPIIFLTVLIACVGGGYWYAHKKLYKKERIWKPSGVESAIIGFYGLLLSFTLLFSGNANKERITLVHQHADALSNLYLESVFLDSSIKDMLYTYIINILETKIKYSTAPADEQLALEKKSDLLNVMLWHSITDNSKKNAQFREEAIKITHAIQLATALDYRTYYSNHDRLPFTIIILVILGSWLVGLLIGFTNGFTHEHHFLVPIIFIVLTGLTVLTILDLNHPSLGQTRPSYENYAGLLTYLKQLHIK